MCECVSHVRLAALAMAMLCATGLGAQEVLMPLADAPVAQRPKTATDSSTTVPFFDDFSRTTLQPTLWDACGATVGTGYGELAPTVGMATLDALDADGNLYPQAATTPFPADTLLSRRIRLDAVAPSDSLVFSFFYLPGGGSGNLWERIGDTPDPTDSLFLDFYAANDSCWHTMWSHGGISVDTLVAHTGTAWQYVALSVTDSVFFDSTFRFRFRNHCSLDATTKKGMKGNCDQWNIDYVLLDTGRSATAEPYWRDVAFAETAPSMLKHYRAMPARQYRHSEMADNISLTITNLFNSDLATQYSYYIIDGHGDTVHRYNGGFDNAPADSYQTADAHAHPPVAYAFDEDTAQRTYEVVHVVREGTGGDSHQQNDTVRFFQTLGNYYAYDDGAPENGYGLTSTASHVYLAYRFDLNEADTLSAVAIYFNRTYEAENESIGFYLTVWQADDNGRPGTVLYSDNERRHPQFGPLCTYQNYPLEQPVVVDGSIFVGFEQVGNDFINIGFDRNNQSADRIWYLTSTEWQQSILRGSLMLRPCFGTLAVGSIVSPTQENGDIVLFPNPADDHFSLDIEGCSVTIYDMTGRMVTTATGQHIDTGRLTPGFYIVRITSPDMALHYRKLTITH